MVQDTVNITVRISNETQKKLDQVAESFDRSRNWLINEAIDNYLEVYEWQKKRIKQRLKMAEKGGKLIKGEQVDKIVDSFKP
jgi:predicted transcriptional regulator